jgi:hypothetical protein
MCSMALATTFFPLPMFLSLWELDRAKMPLDPKERLAGWTKLLNMIKDDVESGGLKDWGAFPGEHAGYAIMEGTELEVLIGAEKYVPFVAVRNALSPIVKPSLGRYEGALTSVNRCYGNVAWGYYVSPFFFFSSTPRSTVFQVQTTTEKR